MRRRQIKEFFLATSILIILLASGVVPAAVYAATDQAENPESWLNDEEKAWVASIRVADSSVRGVSADATWVLWNYTSDKKVQIMAILAMLHNNLRQFCNIPTPEEFQQIGQDYCDMATHFDNRYGLSPNSYGGPAETDVINLATLAFTMTATQRELDSLEGRLNVLARKLTAKIVDIAERREKAAEMLEELFDEYCFIATAAYGTPAREEINILRRFRDEALLTNDIGKAFVDFYYENSPPVAQFISEHEWLRVMVRECIVDPAVDTLGCTEKWWSR